MINVPNTLIGLCLLALLSNGALDVAKPLSPFPPVFSFAGSWSCTGTFRSNKTHRARFTASSALGGKWLVLTEIDLEPSTGYEATYLIGYEPVERELVEFDANTFGAATYWSSQGWQAGVLIMESRKSISLNRSYVADRFVYATTVAPDAFTVEWQKNQSTNRLG